MERIAETELNKLQKWINADKPTINFDPKKSSYCISKPRNKCLPVHFNRGLTMGTKVLKYKENTRYLGLLLDHKLTWDSHIQELNKKLVKYTGIFSKIRYCLPLTCRHAVYNAFIKNIRTPINSLYRESGVLKLRDLHDFNICCTVHKFIHFPHLLPDAVNTIFFRNEQIHHYDTRNKKDLHPIKIKTKLY